MALPNSTGIKSLAEYYKTREISGDHAAGRGANRTRPGVSGRQYEAGAALEQLQKDDKARVGFHLSMWL